MTNFNFQGKIIRHFWGKLIRQSTKTERRRVRMSNFMFTMCYLGGAV